LSFSYRSFRRSWAIKSEECIKRCSLGAFRPLIDGASRGRAIDILPPSAVAGSCG